VQGRSGDRDVQGRSGDRDVQGRSGDRDVQERSGGRCATVSGGRGHGSSFGRDWCFGCGSCSGSDSVAGLGCFASFCSGCGSDCAFSPHASFCSHSDCDSDFDCGCGCAFASAWANGHLCETGCAHVTDFVSQRVIYEKESDGDFCWKAFGTSEKKDSEHQILTCRLEKVWLRIFRFP